VRRLFSSAIEHVGARGFAASHGVQGASAAEKRIGLQDDRATVATSAKIPYSSILRVRTSYYVDFINYE